MGGFLVYDSFITTITLPESLRIIETNAFEGAWIESGVIVVPAGVELIEYGAFGLYSAPDMEIVLMSPSTHIETAAEYAARTGESWVLEDDWTPTVYTRGWE